MKNKNKFLGFLISIYYSYPVNGWHLHFILNKNEAPLIVAELTYFHVHRMVGAYDF